MKKDKIIFLLLFSFISCFVFSAEKNTADIFEMKSRLEALISDKISRSIQTRLHPDDFKVSVNLLISREELFKGNESETQFLPGLPGYVSTDTIMNLYESDLAKMNKEKLYDMEQLKKYKVLSANISVGLIRDFDQDYRTQLQKWLESITKRDFGRTSTAEVYLVNQRPPPIKQTISISELLEKFQWPLLGVLFSLLAFGAVVLYQWFMTKLKNAEMKHKAMLKQMDIQNDRDLEEARKKQLTKDKEVELLRNEEQNFNNRKFEIQKRLSASLKNFPDPKSAISSLLSYDNGGKKIAALLDAAFAIEGAKQTDFKVPEVFFQLDIPEALRKDIFKSFSEYKNLRGEDQLKVLEDSFWSLATIGVLSDYQDKNMFQYLRRVPIKSISHILRNTKVDEQIVAVLHLPEEYQRTYFSQLDDASKLDLIQSTFEIEKVTWNELQDINQSVMKTFKKTEGDFVVSEKAIELIKSLRAIDEIKILTRLFQVNGEAANNIRSKYLTLAFIDQWSIESVRLLLEGVQATDIAALVKLIPAAKKKLLDSVSEMVARILEDDIELMNTSANSTAIAESVERMRQRLRELESGGVLDVDKVFYGVAVEVLDRNVAAA